MPRIYLSDVTCPPEVARELEKLGYEVRDEKPPAEPAPGDLTLVPARTGITSNLRHSLNNPLTAVIGFTQLLSRRQDLPEDVMLKIEKINAHADRIRALIQKVEDLNA